ncbi:MAG TPA: 3-oxoacyl-[acyl-carrier-protein] reductase [Terriglobia bacterium]|nr:3-oxoacyl-[acyl-carrier-protein] reductase [Terriglobia bacterium]
MTDQRVTDHRPAFEGKVALITGASQGIGKACARALAEAGASVALGARNVEKLRAAAAAIGADGATVLPLSLDVSKADSVQTAVNAVIETWGKIDILVNNAGITRDNLLLRMKPEDWEVVLKTNLEGAYYCIRAVLPFMVRARYGRIVNIASVVAQAGNPGQANYIASKAGLIGLTKAVAAEVGSRSITVNAVSPGFIETAMTEKLPEAVKQKIQGLVPLGRTGKDYEIASAVRFLASDEAAYITGHCLNVNGGMYMA